VLYYHQQYSGIKLNLKNHTSSRIKRGVFVTNLRHDKLIPFVWQIHIDENPWNEGLGWGAYPSEFKPARKLCIEKKYFARNLYHNIQFNVLNKSQPIENNRNKLDSINLPLIYGYHHYKYILRKR